MTDIQDIAAAARQAEISISALCRAAGTTERSYYKALSNEVEMRPQTARRLRLGLARMRMQNRMGPEPSDQRAIYLLCLMLAGLRSGLDPLEVLAQDPARRATSDADWARAAKVRRHALYLANIGVGMRQADVARAANMTRQAVSIAMKDIEDDRDDQALDEYLTWFEKVFSA